jgi:hypothetical protein
MIFSGCLGGLQVTHLDGASYHHPKIWENQHLGMGQCFLSPVEPWHHRLEWINMINV